MSAADVARRIADRLDENGIAYAIGGALALGVWGAPRNTVDVDISVFVDPTDLDGVIDALERAGALFERDKVASSIARIGLLRARVGRTPIDVFISRHPHFAEMARRKRGVKDPDGAVRWFLSPEDLAILKLFYARAKDVTDLERLFAVRQTLDLDYIREWLGKMAPAGDPRHSVLDDLVARFGRA